MTVKTPTLLAVLKKRAAGTAVDSETFYAALRTSYVYMPCTPDADGDLVPMTSQYDDGEYLIAFTSPKLLRETISGDYETSRDRGHEIFHAATANGHAILFNPTLPTAVGIPPNR